jgi:hypothetical protein
MPTPEVTPNTSLGEQIRFSPTPNAYNMPPLPEYLAQQVATERGVAVESLTDSESWGKDEKAEKLVLETIIPHETTLNLLYDPAKLEFFRYSAEVFPFLDIL